jgi:hypothetical protein
MKRGATATGAPLVRAIICSVHHAAAVCSMRHGRLSMELADTAAAMREPRPPSARRAVGSRLQASS